MIENCTRNFNQFHRCIHIRLKIKPQLNKRKVVCLHHKEEKKIKIDSMLYDKFRI